MQGWLAVLALALALLFSLQLWEREPEEFHEEVEEEGTIWGSVARILTLFAATFLAPLALLVWQQRKMLYRPEVPGRPRVATGPRASPSFWGLKHEGFFLRSRDGTKLHAWLLRNGTSPKRPAVLFFHSNAGDIAQRLDFFSRLCRNLDVVVLAMEYRSFGRSEDAGISEESFVEDALCAYEWLVGYAAQEKSGIDPARIFLFGRSLGGCVTVRLVSRLLGAGAALRAPPAAPIPGAAEAALPPLPPLPAGVVIENSPSSLVDVAMHLLPFLRCLPRGVLCWPLVLDEWRSAEWLEWIGDVLAEKQKTLGVCLLSAARDQVVPPSCMAKLRAVAEKRPELSVAFHSFQRGEHMNTYVVAGDSYWEALRRFLL